MEMKDKIRVHVVGCGTDSYGVANVVDQEVCGDTVFCVAIDRENDLVKGCFCGKFDDDTIAVILSVLNDQIGTQRVIRGMVRALGLPKVKKLEEIAHE